jgi:aminoglycoside phosphotransferase (APT) family kinase protein
MNMSRVVALSEPLRTVYETVPQHWQQLAAYLAAHGMQLQTDPPPRQFAGGFANLNYLIQVDGKDAVLRRPPRGPLPAGAYDMEREFRILSRLWQKFPLAPRGLHLCQDAGIIGAQFQIVEFRPGISLRELPESVRGDTQLGEVLGQTMIDVLIELHRVDPSQVGLDSLGKPQGFLRRCIDGWVQRATVAVEGWGSPQTLQLIVELAQWLRERQVEDGATTLLHNDFKLDNLLLDPLTFTPLAVLDWDQGTRGDGLLDLAILLSYWTEHGDPPAMHRMGQMPTSQPGFPTRQQVAERYAIALGRSLEHFQFYRVLAQLRTAVVFQQLHARWRRGETRDHRYASFGQLAEGLLEFARAIARSEVF